MTEPLGILVGVDSSAESIRALDWAAAEAVARGAPLTVCHVLRHEPVDVPYPDRVLHRIVDRGQQVLDSAVERAGVANPGLRVAGRLDCGPVAEVLIDLAAAAEEVVLGSRGAGGFYRLRLGSIPAQLAAHAICPVTVVRGEVGGLGVVVGVDGPESRAAIDYAFDYADRHGLAVQPLHAYPLPMPLPRVGYLPPPGEQPQDAALRLVTDSVQLWVKKYPQVRVDPIVVPGHPVSALTDASRGSALVVVGGRGRGDFAELLLGSVSQALLQHAHCPVTVVR